MSIGDLCGIELIGGFSGDGTTPSGPRRDVRARRSQAVCDVTDGPRRSQHPGPARTRRNSGCGELPSDVPRQVTRRIHCETWSCRRGGGRSPHVAADDRQVTVNGGPGGSTPRGRGQRAYGDLRRIPSYGGQPPQAPPHHINPKSSINLQSAVSNLQQSPIAQSTISN